MRRLLAAAMLSVVALSAQAGSGDLSLYIGAATNHPFSDGYDYQVEDKTKWQYRDGEWKHPMITERREFNESNDLLAIEYKNVFVGYFRNSFDDDTFALGYRFSHKIGKHWEASLVAGATYGYRDCTSSWDQFESKKVCPALSPMLSYTKYKLKPTVAVIGEAVSLTGRVDF